MTARGNIGIASSIGQDCYAAYNLFHKQIPSIGVTIHAVSAETSGIALLTQNNAIVDKVGIASNGDIFFYDVNYGPYQITTSQNSGEHWVVNVTNTTITGSFTIAAVGSSQSITPANFTSLFINQDIQVSDGTHTINGKITAVGASLTVTTTSLLGTTAAGATMASGATLGSIVIVTQTASAFRASAYAFA